MIYLKKFFLPLFIIISVLFCLKVFRHIPAAKLWKDYTVFYIQNNASEETVLSSFSEYGCNDVISFSNQKVPIDISNTSPEVSLSLTHLESSNYLEGRSLYFFDKTKTYKVYYIPEIYEKNVSDVVSFLCEQGFSCGMNSRSSFPYAAIIITVIFALVLAFFSKEKLLFLALSVVPVFFVFSRPFYEVSSAWCIVLTVFFLCFTFVNRKKAVSAILHNLMIVVLFGISILAFIFSSISTALLFIFSLLAEFSVIILFKNMKEKFNKNADFNPVKIIPATMLSVKTKQNKKTLALCVISCFLIFIFALFSSHVNYSNSSSKALLLPASRGKIGSLPGIEDFVFWKWETLTFPYKSLNEKQKRSDFGETVLFHRFNVQNGVISEETNSITFDEQFKNEAILKIDSLPYPALEKMLKQQDTFLQNGFSSSGSFTVSVLEFIILVVLVAIPAIFFLREFNKKHVAKG